MSAKYKILVINPGSTSTKIAVFENGTQLWKENIKHGVEDLAPFSGILEQVPFRKDVILSRLKDNAFDLGTFAAIVGRGGMLRPLESGTYEVNSLMLEDLYESRRGEHASNLGAILAWELSKDSSLKSYIVDPVCVDELEPLARYSGIKALPRESIFHALNVKSVARQYARSLGKTLNEMNLVVAHMGGGITVSALKKGRAVEVNHGLYEGAFTPERAGNLPNLPFFEHSMGMDAKKVKNMVVGRGGLVDLLGTSDAVEVEKRIESGDTIAREVYEAMAYQVSQQIGARAAVLCGEVDAVIITGGLAYAVDYLNKWIEERVKFIAPVVVIPGENEMEALALGALRVLSNEEPAQTY